ncbi:MAG: hypothetical protein NC251_00335 [Lachnoclostridium sp.]|nr:hypothetical protein [Lachnospira sp.]MCM1246864.1 hypothetical protein [Lachnoclostridium sp.]
MRERKSITKAVFVLVAVLFAGALCGCGQSVNAPQCLKAYLDNGLKGDTKSVVELKLAISESAAADTYEDGMDAQFGAFFSSFGISKEWEADFREVMPEIFAGAKYEVGDFTQQEDGSCIVTVSYERMQVFEPAMDDALKAYEKELKSWKENPSSAPQSDGEMKEAFFTLFRGSIRKMLVNAKYEDPAETTITLVKTAKQCYVPAKRDLEDLESEFFDKPDADKLPFFDITNLYDFDAAMYVQGLLDNSYKNDSALFCEATGFSKNEAAVIYELGVTGEMSDFAAVIDSDISEELYHEFWELMKELLSRVKYTVGDAKRQEDGTYTVQVTYEQMKLFEPMIADAAQKFNQKMLEWQTVPAQFPDSEDAVTEQMLIIERDCIREILLHPEYKEPETMTVTLVPEGEYYVMKQEDQLKLQNNFFDFETLSWFP